MLETGIQLPGHQLEPQMAKRKNPDIQEFWDLSLTWRQTCIYITHTHIYIHIDAHIDWETNGLGSSILRGGPVVE